MPTTAPKPPPPPIKRPSAATIPSSTRTTTVRRGTSASGEKVVIYGSGGAGKSTLCSLLENVGVRTLFIDVGDSTSHLDVARAEPFPETFDDVRTILHDTKLLADFGAVVIDDFTKLEEMAIAWTLETIPKELQGGGTARVNSVEGYGWGKGYVHVYETFLLILADLDALARQGKHVVGTAHQMTTSVPNPKGDDWLQYQPRLLSTKQAQLRERVREWAYHLVYIDFDTAVDKEGKAKGGTTRTIYPNPTATHWAKSRLLDEPIPYDLGSVEFWNRIFKK